MNLGLRRTVVCAIRRAMAVTIALVAGFAVTSAVIVAAGRPMLFKQEQRVSQAPAPDLAGALIVEHHCWTNHDEMPVDMEGEVPGHVIVTVDGRVRYGGKRLVEKALDQVFNGVDHGFTVNAFCR